MVIRTDMMKNNRDRRLALHLSRRRLTSNLPQNHSNVSECGPLVRNLPGLVRNAQVRWKRAGRRCRANPATCRTIGADFRRRRRKWLLAFGLERFVQGRQVLVEELFELFCHVIEFASES